MIISIIYNKIEQPKQKKQKQKKQKKSKKKRGGCPPLFVKLCFRT